MKQSTKKICISALISVFLLCVAVLGVSFFLSSSKIETASAYTNTIRYGSDGVKDYNTKHWETGNGGRIKGESSGTMTFGAGDISTDAVSFTAATFDNSGGNYKYSVGGTAHAMFWTFQTSTRLYSGSKTQSMFRWLAEADGSVKLSGLIGKYKVNGSSAVELPWMNIDWGSSAFDWYDSATFEISVWRAPVNGTPICIDSQSFSSAFRYDINESGKEYYVKAGDAMYVCIKLSAWSVAGTSEWSSSCLTLVSAQFTPFVDAAGGYTFKDNLANGVGTHYWSYMTDQNVRGYNQTSGRWNYRAATISAANGYSIKDTFTHTTSGTDNKRFVGSSNTNNIFWAYQVVTSEEKATVFEWTAEDTGTVAFTGLAAKTISNKGLLANKTGTKVKALYSNWENSSYAWHNGQSFTLGMYKVATNGTVTVLDEHTYTDEFIWLVPNSEVSVVEGDRIVFALKCNEDGGSGWNTGTAMIVEADFDQAAKVLTLAQTVTKNMILQRNKNVNVSGYGEPGNTVTVTFAGQTKTDVIDSEGEWIVTLDPMAASFEDRTMTITDGTTTKTLTGVRVGDVWLCSGQSNMACTIAELIRYKTAFKSYDPWSTSAAQMKEDFKNTALYDFYNYESNFSKVRLCNVGYNAASTPDKKGKDATWTNEQYGWAQSSTLNQWAGYSMYALGFAFRMQQASGVPVGVVVCAVGGSSVEEWLSEQTIADYNLTMLYDQSLKPHSRFYNGMIYAIRNVTFDGLLWYQGEADAGQYNVIDPWVNGWSDKMVAFVAQERKFYGNIPVIVQQLAEKDSWTFLQGMREVQWNLQNRVSDLYTSVGIASGVPYDNLDPEETSNFVHPLDKYGISRNAANIAMRYVYGDTSCAGIAAYPVKAYRSGSNIIIDYGAMENGYKLKLSEGSQVYNLRAYNKSSSNWENVSGATVNGTKIIVPNATNYTAFSYAGFSLMDNGATTKTPDSESYKRIVYPEWNSDKRVNLYSENGIPCAPFQYLGVSSTGSSGQSVTLGEDLSVKFTFNINSYYSNPSVTFKFNGNTTVVNATANADGSYTAKFSGIAPQDMNDKVTIDKISVTDAKGLSVDLKLYWDTATEGYSIVDYLVAFRAAYSDDASQKLAVNMLNYGYQAQVYLGHDLANPINASVSSADQSKYAIAYDQSVVSAAAVRSLDGTDSDLVKFQAVRMYYDSKNGFAVKFYVAKSVDGEVSLKVTSSGVDKDISASSMIMTEDEYCRYYTAYYNNLSITELKTQFNFNVMIDGVATGKTLHYNAYANIGALSGAGDNNADLLKALYAYGYAVESYVNA